MSNKYRPRRWREKRQKHWLDKKVDRYRAPLPPLFQDVKGTIPATNNGDLVARMGSFIQPDPARRPILVTGVTGFCNSVGPVQVWFNKSEHSDR